MNLAKFFGSTSIAMLLAATAANATTIVNLSANASNPNAGNSSGTYTYNPVSLNLAAGNYTVNVVGIAGGGLYDGYAVYAPTTTNNAFTDGNWSVSVNGVVQTVLSNTRSNTAAGALAIYSPMQLTFSLASASTVALFYVDDTVFPYFADDAGGVSLGVNAVPEPMSLAILGSGMLGLGIARRRRKSAAAVAA